MLFRSVFVNFATVTETDFTVRVGKNSFVVNEEYLRMLFNLPQPEGEGPTEHDLELKREKALEMQNFYERCVTEDGLKKYPKFKSYIHKNLLLPGWSAIATIIQEAVRLARMGYIKGLGLVTLDEDFLGAIEGRDALGEAMRFARALSAATSGRPGA